MIDFTFTKHPNENKWTIKFVTTSGNFAKHIYKAVQDCMFKRVKE